MEIGLVTYKTAKLAQDKGFIGNADVGLYDDKEMYHPRMAHWLVGNKNLIDAPTQSLLQKWLREIHDNEVFVKSEYKNLKKIGFYYGGTKVYYSAPIFKTYELALEKGLQEALKLI
tara:strand:+ start:365 stop:712 length:348 start_codon:yes stop_codon:yes gene_type:complete